MPLTLLREAVASLNLFESYSDDPGMVRSERLRTRFYLVVFSLALIAIVVYGALSLRTTTITKYSPTEHHFEQLSGRYPETTRCPCSRVSITFSEFIRLDVTYHPVCSSDFISQTWIDATFNQNVTRLSPIDVRKTLSVFWQTIRSLCDLVKTAVSDGFDDFKARSFISPEAQTREYLQTQARLNLNFSLETSLAKLQRNLLMVRQSISGNRFISGLSTNYLMVTNYNLTVGSTVQPEPVVLPNGCSCFDPSGCPQHTLLFANQSATDGTSVPGMMFNCQPFDGALASSLECFYQSSCLSLLQQALFIPITPLPLTSSRSRFPPTTTMQALVDELMIEQLIDELLFTQYYSQCDPTYCIYWYSHRFDVLFIITLLISAFGGLSIILKLVSSLLVKSLAVIRERWVGRNLRVANTRPQPSYPRKNFGAHLRTWIGKIVRFLVHLNLFATTTPDLFKMHRQRITTRVFIVVLLLCLYVFTFYQWTAIQTETRTVPRPSQAQYNQLYENHRATLRCLCSQPFVPYSAFIEISPRLHQVCSSALISSTWYTHLAFINATGRLASSSAFWPTFGSSYFRLLASFCSLVQTTINDTYGVFSMNVYTNDQVVPRGILLAQAQEFSDLYIKSTEAETNRSFSFTRETTQLNQFITGKGDNFNMFVYSNGEIAMREGSPGYPNPLSPDDNTGGCLCISDGSLCGFYPYFTTDGSNQIYFTSLVIKCFSSESVLSSTLECWYDPNCMTLMRNSYTWIGLPGVMEISLLDRTIESRFLIDTTIDTMMQRLFLENWTMSFSYDRYYNTCAPISCIYTIQQQFDLFLVVVTAAAVYSGLSKGLRLFIPLLVSLLLLLLRYVRARRSTAVQPITSMEIPEHPVSTTSRLATIRKHVFEFNIYDSPISTEHTRRQERLNTRVYIALLFFSIIAIVFYAGLIQHSENRIVQTPSQSTYDKLFAQYSDTLQCPCSSISIAQNDFISRLNASLHPVCSSALVSDEWSTYLTGNPLITANQILLAVDFRRWGLLLFKTLTSLCSMANETLEIAIAQYQARRFISNQLLPQPLFQVENDARMQQFQSATSTIFRSIVGPTRAAAQGNALITVFKTNWILKIDYFAIGVPLLTAPVVYNNSNCTCATSSSCSQPARFFDDDHALYYTVLDVFQGCTPLDSLLMSSLSCFFSPTCLESFLGAIPLTATGFLYGAEPYSMPPLRFSSSNTRFRVNDTLETIIGALFIDSWSSEISYSNYFDACQPLRCTHVFTQRLDITRVATIFLSVFGGLSAILRFGTPQLIRIVKKLLDLFRRRSLRTT